MKLSQPLLSKKAKTLELEVLLCVVVADIFNHLAQEVYLACRQQAVLYIVSDKVTERSAEILVARVRHETA